MNDSGSTHSMTRFGTAGFFVGALLGFLVRPSAFLIGQLPFEVVIARGANLKGADQMLVPLAQTSFNILVVGGIIGAIVGVLIGYFVYRKKAGPVSI